MDFYLVLQSILDEKSLSIPDAARLSGLSDSTIRTILSRKNKSVSLDVAFKLSAGLGVPMDQLNTGVSVAPSLTSRPASLTTLNDQLNPAGQAKLLTYAQDLVATGLYAPALPLGKTGVKMA